MSKKKTTDTAQSNAANVLTVAQLQSALVNANKLYIARNDAPKLNSEGMSANIATAYSIVSAMSETHLKEIAEMGINDVMLQCLNDASNIKKTMRITQAVMFVLTGSGKYVKSSVKTFLLEYLGIVACGAKNRSGMKFCATGKGTEHTSDEVRNTANALKLRSALGGAVSVKSVDTQDSVGFSKGGIGEALGLCKKSGKGLPEINHDSKVMVKLDAFISKLTDNSIALIAAQSKERANS